MNTFFCRLTGATLGAVALLAAPAAYAQNSSDFEKYKSEALLFSQLQATGSTRTQSLGGAGSSLGADLGSVVLNPANLGTYIRSEVSFTPGLLINSYDTDAGFGRTPRVSSSSDGRNNFNIANLGIVINTRKDDSDPSDWRSGAVGINFSRLATFSNQRTYALPNIDSSQSIQEYIVQDFALSGNSDAQAVVNNVDVNNDIQYFADLGYGGFLLNFEQNPQGQYTNRYFAPIWAGTARQTETSELRGAVNQIDIGYGASYRDKLYVGGSLGIVTMRYKETRLLEEKLNNPTSELESITLRDSREVQGAGINLRIGLVYRPLDAVRIGASIQTPTFASDLKEQVDPTTLDTRFRVPFPGGAGSVTSANASISASELQYTLTTPFRATGGLTLISKKIGLITADIDYVNYGSARLSAIDNDPAQANFSAANAAIRNEYTSAVNVRLGAELKLGEFRVRGGYGRYGSPYAEATRGGERTVIGGGVGIRRAGGYVDVGFARTTYSPDQYSPYTITTFDPGTTGNPNANPPIPPRPARYLPYNAANAAEPVVSAKVTLLNPTVTVGFTF